MPSANSLLPLDTLGGTIKAHIVAGDKATGKAEEHYKSAGLLLLEAKQRLPLESPGKKWNAFLAGTCKIGTSRAYELIAIAEGRTSVAEVQAKGRDRAARHATKNKAARSSVSNGQSPSPDPLSEQRNIITAAMRDLCLESLTQLAAHAISLKKMQPDIERIRVRQDKMASRASRSSHVLN